MDPILSRLDTKALCAKIFVCCPDQVRRSVLSNDARTVNFIYYSFDVEFFNLEIKILKMYILADMRLNWAVMLSQWAWQPSVHYGVHHCCLTDKLSYQWTCGDWGWGQHAACSLSPRYGLLQGADQPTDQSLTFQYSPSPLPRPPFQQDSTQNVWHSHCRL